MGEKAKPYDANRNGVVGSVLPPIATYLSLEDFEQKTLEKMTPEEQRIQKIRDYYQNIRQDYNRGVGASRTRWRQ